MSTDTTLPMTAAALGSLTAELDRLVTVVRPDALTALESALTDSVNVGESGTHLSALAEKEQVDARIAELRSRIARAVVVEAISTDAVSVGCVVELDYGDGDVESLVLDDASTGATPSVSPASPLGRALVGAAVGDTVRWDAPAGEMVATVVGISA